MKILFEIEDRVRKDSTCVYFRKAFEKLADCVVVYPEELQFIKPGIFDLHIRVDYGIDNRAWNPELHPSVYYAIDTHLHADWRIKMAEDAKFDYIFCAQPRGTTEKWHTDKVYWLPLACDPDYHRVLWKPDKIYDIAFVGNCQPFWQSKRVERLDKLFKAVPNFVHRNVTFKDMAQTYAESRIVFNSAVKDDINMRVFEAMCSGTPLLTDRQDWEGLFDPKFHFFDYATDEEMIDKAKYMLARPSEAEERAKIAQNLVIKSHTYLHRAKHILEKCL